MRRSVRLVPVAATIAAIQGCATPQRAPFDYAAFIEARPVSMLVLPPLNDSPEVKATAGVWSQVTRPLAEAGYYVLPVTLVDTMLRENGVQTAADAQQIPLPRLREVFGADAALYLKVRQYGTSYAVLTSETRVAVEARLLDLRSGRQLWAGQAAASSAEQSNQAVGGLVGLLAHALIKQVVETATDAGYDYAAIANARLLAVPRREGILAGPRSPLYGQPPAR